MGVLAACLLDEMPIKETRSGQVRIGTHKDLRRTIRAEFALRQKSVLILARVWKVRGRAENHERSGVKYAGADFATGSP